MLGAVGVAAVILAMVVFVELVVLATVQSRQMVALTATEMSRKKKFVMLELSVIPTKIDARQNVTKLKD